MYLFEFTVFENLDEYITSEEIEKYLFFLRGVTVLMEYENDDTPVNLHSINEMLPEFIEKEKTNIMVSDDNELLSYIMIGRNKASDLSFYNIHEGFHMEMRMFSLDSLLFEKPNPPGEVIVSELSRFILYTENLMMNVIKALNQAYSKTGPFDIKPSQRKMLKTHYYLVKDLILLKSKK